MGVFDNPSNSLHRACFSCFHPVVGLKKIDSRNDSNRKSLCEEGGGCLFFGRFGPIVEK